MTPQEIAEHLAAHLDTPHLDSLLQELKPQLTLEVMRALGYLAVDAARGNPYTGLQIADLSSAVARVIGSEEAQAFGIWNQGNVCIRLNEYQRALNCFRHAEKFYASARKTVEVVGLQVNQVTVLRELGAYKQALALAQKARKSGTNIQDGRVKSYMANLDIVTAWIYEEIGDFETALANYERARQVFIKLNKPNAVASGDLNRAHLLETMDRHIEAEALLYEVRAKFEEAQLTASLARADLNLGRVSYRRGQYQQALQRLELALEGFASIPLPIEVANVNLYRVAVYHKLNLPQEMITLAREAETIFQQNRMIRERVLALFYQGIGCARLGMRPPAEKYLAKARRLLHQQGAAYKLWLVDAERAEVAWQDGRLNTARRIARRVLAQIDGHKQPALAARMHLLLARYAAMAAPGNLGQARRHLEQALHMTETFHLLDEQIFSCHFLAEVRWQAGEWEASWAALQQAIQTCEHLRHDLLLDDFQLGFMEDKLPIYAQAVHQAFCRWQQQALTAGQLFGYLNLAQQAPLVETRVLHTETITESHTLLQEQLAALRQSWRWYHDKLSDLGEQDKGVDAAGVREKLVQIEAEIAELRRRDRIGRVNMAETNGMADTAPEALLGKLQARLGAKEALVQFFEVSGQVQVFLLTAEHHAVLKDVAPLQALHQQLRAWQFFVQQLSPFAEDTNDGGGVARLHLARLYRLVWQPLQPHLHQVEQLYLIIPPAWQELPVAALYDGRHYVVEQTKITYLTTAEALLQEVAETQPGSGLPPEAWVFAYSEEGRLPSVRQEAQAIAGVLSQDWQTHLMLEKDATQQALNAAAQHGRLLHLATHAVFRADNPLFSWLSLADARLTVAEWYEMPLRQRPLVVLSGCETGRGTPRGGGLLGMGRGLLAAGASGLILTLWRVEDQHSARLMTNFYAALQSERRRPASGHIIGALQQAQTAAIAAGLSPFYWAGFIYAAG